MDLVILESDVILVNVVPFLDSDLIGSGPGLGRHQLLEVADGVVLVAFHPDLLSEPVVQHYLDHVLSGAAAAPSYSPPPIVGCEALRLAMEPLCALKY